MLEKDIRSGAQKPEPATYAAPHDDTFEVLMAAMTAEGASLEWILDRRGSDERRAE